MTLEPNDTHTSAPDTQHRIQQTSQRIQVLEARAAASRAKVSTGARLPRSGVGGWFRLPPLSLDALSPSGRVLAASLIFTVLLMLAEFMTAAVSAQLGLLMHSLLLFLTAYQIGRWWEEPVSRVLICLLLAPLIRLLSLSLPLVGFPMHVWWLTVSVPLFAATFIVIRLLGLSWRDTGHHLGRGPIWFSLPVQYSIGCVGILFGVTEFIILRPAPMVESLAWAEIWLPIVVIMICTGYLEELVFRGVMQHTMRETQSTFVSNLVVSLIFAALHIGYLSVADYIFVFTASMILGILYEKTGSLLGITIAHGVTNVLLFIVLPILAGYEPALQPF